MSWRMDPSRLSVVKAVTRRMVPYLVGSDASPDGIVLRVLHHLRAQVGDRRGAAWTRPAVGRRIVSGRPIPGLLVLAAVGISVRTVVYLFNSNNFVYFFQPILRAVVTGAFFALSVVVGRPLIARFAADLLSSEVENRPAVARLFRRLTYLWAAVNGLVAAASLTLLLTVPVGVFAGTETAAVWVITCIGVVLTVSDAVRTARREGLATAVAANGRLHAYVTSSA